MSDHMLAVQERAILVSQQTRGAVPRGWGSKKLGHCWNSGGNWQIRRPTKHPSV